MSRPVPDYKPIISCAVTGSGDLLEVRAGLVKMGGKPLTVTYEMNNLGSGEIAATLECAMVLFDQHERSAVTIPDDLRNTASQFLRPPAGA